MKTLCFILLLASGGAIVAQETQRNDTDDTSGAAVLAKAEAGDALGAAVAAGVHNTAQKGGMVWFQQSAAELIRYGYVLKGKQDDNGVRRAAMAAAKILQAALQRDDATATAADRAQIYAELGRTYLELIGDRRSAERYLAQALHEDPENFTANGLLEHLAAEDAALRRFINKGQ